jgi:hypothetical protein
LEQVKQAGLKVRPYGDVYQGGPLSDTAISVAKAIQNNIEGFGMWTGLNDVYHKEKHPRSSHAFGRGLDMTMARMPSPEESKALKAQMLKIPGVKSVHNEYYKPPIGDMNQYTTGPHFHIDAQARNGGMFEGPNSGYPATLHGKEAVIPLSNSGGNFVELFAEIAENSRSTNILLEEMVRAQKNSVDVQQKILRVQS